MATTISPGLRAPRRIPPRRVPAAELVPGDWRHAGRHRDHRRELAAILLAAARVLVRAVRETGMHVAAMVAFTVAGFTVSATAGWVVAGLALIWTQHLSADSPPGA